MHRTTRYLLLGVFVLAFILVFATRYFFDAKPAPDPASVSNAPAPETDVAEIAATAGDVQDLLSANGCLGCHAVDKKVVGPAYRDVAARYKDDEHALAKVTASIRQGGAERWGDVPMPPMPNLTEAQAQLLAGFVLQQ